MRHGRDGDVGGDLRLPHHVQAPDAGRMVGDRGMMLRQIVDEQGDAGFALRKDGGQRLPLASLIPAHRKIKAMRRELFDAVSAVVAQSFVNVYPTAVRTFRELVKPQIKVESRPKNYAHGGSVITGGGLMDAIKTTNIAYEPRTQARQSTIDKVTRAVKDELDEMGTKIKKKAKKKARELIYDDRG